MCHGSLDLQVTAASEKGILKAASGAILDRGQACRHGYGMKRFEMASALVARARTHQAWIGDDHGDRYEAAMQAGHVSREMQIVAKELFEHLRSALDYCAREVWQHFFPAPSDANIYFPIAREGARASDFPSLMNRSLPGVIAVSPQALLTFQYFQQFANSKNIWLPELATITNQAKHDHLEVTTIPETEVIFSQSPDGDSLMSYAEHHKPKRGSPWMMLTPISGDFKNGTYRAVFIQLKPINVELRTFLNDAIPGVERIIQECQTLLK